MIYKNKQLIKHKVISKILNFFSIANLMILIILLISCHSRPPKSTMEIATEETISQIKNRKIDKKNIKHDWVYIEPVVHTYRYKLRPIDNFIRDKKEDYFNTCLDWVRFSGIPETDCAYNLLDRVERKYGLTNDPQKILKVADEAFFTQVKPMLYKMIAEDPKLQSTIKKEFSTNDAMFSHYQKVYSFTKVSTELLSKMTLEIKKREKEKIPEDNEYSQ